MDDISDFKLLLKEYLATDQIDVIYNLLDKKLNQNSSKYNQFILAKNRLNRHKAESNTGSLNFEQVEVYNSKIRGDILSLINDISSSDFRYEDETPNYSIKKLIEENNILKLKLDNEKNDTEKIKFDKNKIFKLNGKSIRALTFENEINTLLKFIYDILYPVKDSDSFLFAVFTGIITFIKSGLISKDENIFYLDTDIYPSILSYANESDSILAVADLTSDIEQFFEIFPDANKTAVKERTFLLPWKEFFVPEYLSKFLKSIQNHSELYPVKYSHIPITSIRHEGYEDAIGNDFFVVPNSGVAGYYVKKNNKILLKITSKKKHASKALNLYNIISKKAIPFEKDLSKYQSLREKWVQTNNFGTWSWKHLPVEDRGNTYTDYYDIHIRCWIWRYDHLISSTIDAIKSELIDILDISFEKQIKIIEIGFGTGAISIPTIKWINNLNKSFEHKSVNCKIRYFGIDRAEKSMKPLLEKKLLKNIEPHQLLKGIAWSEIRASLRKEKFDLIILSLVLHDIISGDPITKFKYFLEKSKEYLTNKGTILITDIFPSNDHILKEKEMLLWKKAMISIGMSQSQIEGFFKFNLDMIETLHRDELFSISNEYGFEVNIKDIAIAYGDLSPFKIAILRKK